MDTETIAECMTLSFADTPFPIVVQKLAAAGVAAYTADLIALRNTYYGAGGENADEPLPLTEGPPIAARFDGDAVAATVKEIQQGRIGYAEFLRRIMCAGCASYRVFIGGRKAMYFGRDGEFYTEPFPAAK
ncbi:MAG TPA: DUF1398 domain-containing protein [Pseudolabrys sp.]|jgi:uncharacterized protein YbcV (DUF1398 family)|nr:DUF1398 domain-containing protein [Pseudolabrys sp.]